MLVAEINIVLEIIYLGLIFLIVQNLNKILHKIFYQYFNTLLMIVQVKS